MESITITINNKKIITSQGKTILQVVEENNLDTIPTLCHDERIEPYGSCFLCVVEVEGMDKLVPSCATPVNDGMVINTKNKKILNSRKAAIELLMSNHYADCIGPCINNCPAGVDAQGYVALISEGRYKEALKLIKQNNPMPLSIGRVCVRACEDACRRCAIDEPLAINYLKRFVADEDDKNKWVPDLKESNGNKVAVIGGGPAGLTCAYYLALEGYSVTIFEKLHELGGMLRYGIPEYRLPKEILDSEIKWITDLGIEVKTGVEMGKDFYIKDLKKQGFDAIFLSVGAHKATSMDIEGEEKIEGIFKGIDFLRKIETDGIPDLKGTVIIVGGGNTAIDAARTSLRCKADNVKILYRRSLNEMPAHHMEISAAQEEGVEINILTLPKTIIAEKGRLKAIECYKMKLEKAEGDKRPRPVVIPGSEFIIECDYLISAIGQNVDISFIKSEKDCKLEKWGTIVVNKETYETSVAGVFAGGDVVNGPLTAVSAIGQGKKAALSIDEYIKTGKITGKIRKFYSFKNRFGELPQSEFSQFPKIKREKMPEMAIKERINNFKEVELGLSDLQVANESKRCLECGCTEYYDCKLRKYADEFEIDISDYLGEVRKFKVDKSHPFIIFDPNKCINCGKCVRTCSEILTVSALGFVNRGFKSVVKPAMEKPLLDTNCITCGNCIDVCPTAAIAEKFPFKVPGTLPKNDMRSVCSFCSMGCSVNYKVVGDDMFYVSNSNKDITDSVNNGYLCFKGRFGYRYLLGKNKMNSSSIRKNGNSFDVPANEAIEYTSARIREIIEKNGPGSVALFASPKMTNEELYLLQKFARAGLKTNHLSSFSNLQLNKDSESLDDYFGATVSTTTVEDIKKADVIIVMNANLTEDSLIMELKIKEARKKGAKLIVVNSTETNLARYADLWIDTRKGTNTILMNGLINEAINPEDQNFAELREMVSLFDMETVTTLTEVDVEKYQKLLNYIKDNQSNIIFVYNVDSLMEKSKNDLKAICNYLIITGRVNKENNGLILLREFANSTGLLDMGFNPDYLPGYVKFNESKEIKRIGKLWNTELNEVFRPVNTLKDLSEGKIKAVLIFGENPLSNPEYTRYFNDIEFLMVMDAFNTETTIEADVVIAGTNFIGQNGTVTSCDTRIQKIEPVVKKQGSPENSEIISRLAGYFSGQFNNDSFENTFEEIKKVNRLYSCCNINDCWNKNAGNSKFFIDQKKKEYFIYNVDMTTFDNILPVIHYSDDYLIKFVKNKLNKFNKVYE